MHPTERRDRILALLGAHQSLNVDQIVAELDASSATIRRDLALLADQNLLRRFHGGVRLATPGVAPADPAPVPGPVEDAFSLRLTHHTDAKARIARAAVALLQDGVSLLVDTGTTTIAFARQLAVSRQHLTVITNSVAIATIVGQSAGRHRVHLLGGELDPEPMEMLGRMALSQIGQYRAEHVVLTVGCLDATGILDFDEREAEVARAMIARGQKLTVLADHSKMGRAGVFPVASLDEIATLVTDAAPPPEIARALAAAQVRVIVAQG